MIGQPGGGETRSVAEVLETAELMLQYATIARERIVGGKQRVREYVEREPLQALGIALGVGIFIGWLTKRR